MKKNKTKSILVLVAVLSLIVVFMPVFANAETTTTTKPLLRAKLQARATSTKATSTRSALNSTSTKPVKVPKTVTEAIAKADKDIAQRIDSLNKALERITGMKNVSDTEKNSAKTDIQSELANLNLLKSKIDADTDLVTIKKDLASLISGSRIYALVIPKLNILASVDKVNTVATMLTTISVKLQVRVDEAKASSTDVTSLQTALDNITTKVASAKEEAVTAQTTVADLVPDNGNKTILDSNNAKIKLARENIKNANKDLNDARNSAKKITEALKAPGKKDVKLYKGTLSGKNSKAKATTTKSN
jgi:hypothetical protein